MLFSSDKTRTPTMFQKCPDLEHETLSQQIKSNKSSYIQQLKQYKSVIKSRIQLQNNLANFILNYHHLKGIKV